MQFTIWRFPSFIGQQVHGSKVSKKKKNRFYSYSCQFRDSEVSQVNRSTGPQRLGKENSFYAYKYQFGDFRVSQVNRSTGPEQLRKGKEFLFIRILIGRFQSFIGQQVHRSLATKKKKRVQINAVINLEISEFHRSTGPQVPSKVRKKQFLLKQLSIWRFLSFIGQQGHRS